MEKISFHKDYKTNDLKGMHLHGSVKSMKEYLLVNNKRNLRNYYLFNEEGYLVHKKILDDEPSVIIENKKYEDEKLILVDESVFEGDEIVETTKLQYDGNNICEEYCKYENQIVHFHSLIKYTEERNYNTEGFLVESIRRYSNGELGRDLYSYSDNRMKIKTGKYYFQGNCYNLNEESELIFNENGLITEEKREDGKTIYSYKNNSIYEIKNIFYTSGETTLIIDTYLNGRCIKSEYNHYNNCNKYFERDIPEYCSTSYISYEDDTQGNWIKKNDTCKNEHVTFERELEYYN